MALALFLTTCFLALPTSAPAARAAVREAEEVPWRKVAAAGAILAHGLADSVVIGGAPDSKVGGGGSNEFDSESKEDVRRGARSPALTPWLRRKLVVSFSKIRPAAGPEDVEDSLIDAKTQQAEIMVLPGENGGQGFEMLVLPQKSASRSLIVGRYPSRKDRTSDELVSLQTMLWTLEQSKLAEDLFVPYLAQSHTAAEFALEPGAELLVVFDAPSGSLEHLVSQVPLSLEARLSLFAKALKIAEHMKDQNIRHLSDFTPSSVLVVGDISEPSSLRTVFHPSILAYDTINMPSAAETFAEDVRQLGALLRFLLQGRFEKQVQDLSDVFLAFGRAMEAGALSGEGGPLPQFKELLLFTGSPDTTPTMLTAKRMHYLQLSVEAEIAEEIRLKEAEILAA